MIKFREKSYSGISVPLLPIIGIFSLNRLNRKFYDILTSSNFRDKSINDKLLSLIPSKDTIIVNLGSGSFYMNPERVSKKVKDKLLKSLGEEDKKKIENPITLNDYLLKCIVENKKLISYSDLDPTPALAHEIGHMRFDNSKIGNILQSGNTKVISNNLSNLSFLSSILGNDLAASVLPLIFKSPILASEFMASKLGYDLLKEVRCSKDQLDRCKIDLSAAWMTYFTSVLKSGAKHVLTGNLLRRLII